MSSSLLLLVFVVSAQPVQEVPQPPQVRQIQLLLQQRAAIAPVAPGAVPPILADQDDETLLRNVDLPTDPMSLIGFLKRQKVSESAMKQIQTLVVQLGDDEFEIRQNATDELIRIGPSAGSALRAALKSPDLEVVRRAEICLKAIDSVAGPLYQEAVVRLLAKKAPVLALETLLDVLPDLRGPTIVDTAALALSQAGIPGGRPLPALVDALRDKNSVRREAAGEAIARGGDAESRKIVEPLLKDSEVSVRVRVGMALAEAGEKSALPVLISTLREAPLERAYDVESLLLKIAQEQAPLLSLGKTAESRTRAVDAWQQWYQKSAEKLDLAKVLLEANKPGALLLSTMGNVAVAGGIRGKVQEVDAKGKAIWELETNGYAYAVQKLPRDRVLIAEYTSRKVSEKTTKGQVIWSKDLTTYPIDVSRLPGGNTLIATRNALIEVDGEGKDVRTLNRTDIIYAMTAMRNGEIGLITSANRFVRLDRDGKELNSFNLPPGMNTIGRHFAVSPNGNRITIPIYNLGAVVVGGAVVNQPGKVVEFDASGTVIWEAEVERPTSVRRLSNGNVLVGSRYNSTLVELDGRGKVVNKYEAPGGGRVLDAQR